MSMFSARKKLSKCARTLKMTLLDCVIQNWGMDRTKKRVRTAKHPTLKGRGTVFKKSKVAKRYCRGYGIELGASAHNPFGLANCINVAPADEFDFYKDEQGSLCGRYAEIDLVGEAQLIPEIGSHELDYIVSSHVIEHVPDVISAFVEWNRVLKPGGVIVMIFPKKSALDHTREVTPISHFMDDYRNKKTVETHSIEEVGVRRGHYHVFTLASMLELIQSADLDWQILEALETDDKVGNGHMVVARYSPRTVRVAGDDGPNIPT